MPNLYAASTQFLSRQESVAAIGVTCLRGHPHLLPEFLVICRRDIPLLAQALNHELQTPMNTKGIVDALISGPLGAIGLFLRNSQHELPQIRFALQAALVDQITSRAVASKVMTAAFPVIENLLEVAKDEPLYYSKPLQRRLAAPRASSTSCDWSARRICGIFCVFSCLCPRGSTMLQQQSHWS